MYNQIDANKRKTVILMTLFVAFILGLGAFLGSMFGNTYSGLIFAFALSIIMNLISYFKGDKIALRVAGAQKIEKQDNPYVYRMVENLCISVGLPVPNVYIIPDKALNAFATGRDPEHASIALTQGIIDKLENEELEGVIAHELAHIKNYDIRIMTIVIVLVGVVALFSDFLLRFHLFGFGSNDDDGPKLNPIIIVIGIILAILSPLIAQLIQLAISRKREFLADATGALMTRYPEGLARALEKITHDRTPLKRANNATAHLYIANPFHGHKKLFAKMFSTHPPAEERIAALRKMA